MDELKIVLSSVVVFGGWLVAFLMTCLWWDARSERIRQGYWARDYQENYDRVVKERNRLNEFRDRVNDALEKLDE